MNEERQGHCWTIKYETENFKCSLKAIWMKLVLGLNIPHSLKALISGFRCNVDEICVLLGYYAVSCHNYHNYHTMPHNIPEEYRYHSMHS
jgi:hypothetical protein